MGSARTHSVTTGVMVDDAKPTMMILGTVHAESSDGDGGGVMAQPLIEAAAIEEAVCAAFFSFYYYHFFFSVFLGRLTHQSGAF